MNHHSLRIIHHAARLGALLAAGCSESDPASSEGRALSVTRDAAPDPTPESPSDAGDLGDVRPVFFAQQVSEAEDGPISHLAALPGASLDAIAGSDVAALGVSVAGDSPAVAFGTSVFFVSSSEPTIQRFDLDAAGALTEGPSLSFADIGVLDVFPWRVVIASATKAYVFDSENGRAVAWNPAAMQLTGAEIDISASEVPGFTLDPLAYGGRVSGQTLFVPASWYSEDDFASRATMALYAIDIESDELLAYSEDARCAGYVLTRLPSGDVHVLPDNLFVEELTLASDEPAAPCSLRVAAGQVSFDAEFVQDLSDLIEPGRVGAPLGVQGGIGDGSGGIYLGVAASAPGDEPPPPDETDGGATAPEVSYELWRWDVASGSASAVADAAPFYGTLFEQWNGAPPSFALQPAPDPQATRVFDMTATPLRSVDLSGNIVSFARLR